MLRMAEADFAHKQRKIPKNEQIFIDIAHFLRYNKENERSAHLFCCQTLFDGMQDVCYLRRKLWMEKSIEELIYEETDQRLKEMRDPKYQFPKKADKMDAIGIIAGIGVCVLLIVLCMTGVIV